MWRSARVVLHCTLFALFLNGCPRESNKQHGAKHAATPGGETCAEKTAKLRRWILETQSAAYHEPAPAVRHLTVAGTSRLDKGKCVSLSLVHDEPEDRLLLDGLTVAGGDLAAAEQFNVLLHNIYMTTQRYCLFLSIDKQVRWKYVTNVARQMQIIVQQKLKSDRDATRLSKKHPKLIKEAKQAADKVIKELAVPGAGKRGSPEPSRSSKPAVDIALVFNADAPIHAPAASAMERKLQKLGIVLSPGDPTVNHSKISDHIHDLWRDPLFGECMLYKGFPGADLANASSLGDHALIGKLLADHLARQVKACDCKLDLPSLKSLVYHAHSPLRAFNAVWFRADPGGAPVKLPADKPWSATHKTVLSALKKHKTLALQ